MASADQISCRNLGRQSWASAPTDRRGSLSDHPGQRRTAERLRRGCEEMGGNRDRGHPKRGQQRRTIPQSRLRRASSLYTREPCPAGDGGSGRRVVGPYGKPKPAGAQRSVRARGREGWAGIGARTIPKGGPPPRPLRQRLAKRKARKEELVKFRDGIWGVSHGHPALRKSVPTIPQSPYGRQLPFHKGAFDPVAVRAGGYSPPGWGCRSPGR